MLEINAHTLHIGGNVYRPNTNYACSRLMIFGHMIVSGHSAYIIKFGTVSAKIAPRLKCYKNASRLNRYNFPTDSEMV